MSLLIFHKTAKENFIKLLNKTIIKSMKLSIIIPVFNEEKTLIEIIKKVYNTQYPLDKEVIVVNDGSTDDTLKIMRLLLNMYKIKFINNHKHSGKGFATRQGFEIATGDIVVIQDADLEYDPKEIPLLISPIINGEEEVVFGSRFLNDDNKSLNRYTNKAFAFLTNVLYGSNLTDVQTGYKVMTHRVLSDFNFKANGFDIEPEITFSLLKKGYRIREVPISYHPRSKKEGKKIRFKDGMKAVYLLFKLKVAKIEKK